MSGRGFPVSAAFGRWLLVIVALVNLFVYGLTGFSLWQTLREFEQRTEVTARSQAQMLAHDMGKEFEKIDLTLQAAADEIERRQAQDAVDAAALNQQLVRLQQRVPEIISLRTLNEAGIVTFGPGVNPAMRPDNSDREYFTRQRDDPRAGLVVAKPVLARIDQQWVVTVSRALRRSNGDFAGVVYANVALTHLARGFAALDIGQRGSASLRDAGLRIYARHPQPADPGKVFGQRLEVPELQVLVDAGREHGTYVSAHTVDGVERKFAVHKVPSHPLYAVVGRASDEYLLPWREQAAWLMALTLFFSAITLALAWLLHRIWRQQQTMTQALAREEEKFHTVADFTYDWEYWEGPAGEILFMTPSCERMTGYGPAEFCADPGLLRRIVHPDDRERMQDHRHDAARAPEAQLDFRIVRKDGAVRWIAHGCRSVFDHDDLFMGRRVSNHDITERKTAEAELARLNAELEQRVARRTEELETAIYDLENFTYSASHDLRIPLRAIDGFAKLLLTEHTGQLDEEGKRLLNVVRDGARRMAQYIDDMIAFTRSGRSVIQPERLDLAPLVREVMEELMPEGREIELDIAPLPEVVADRSMMRQALLCVLSNAVKFTRSRPLAKIKIGASLGAEEIVYHVRDNGVGFDMLYVGKLFGVFQRLHSVSEFEGNGIGLAVFKRIIARHGGRVWAEGQVGEGATIYFALPDKKEMADG